MDQQDYVGIEKLLVEFPYAYPLSLLKLLHLKAQDSYLFQNALSQTALLSPDREKLWQWVEGDQESLTSAVNPTSPQKQVVKEVISQGVTAHEELRETPKEEETEEVKKIQKIQEVAITKAPVSDATKVNLKESTLAQLDQGSPKKLGDDLSHLPEKVRAVIERSRSVQRKIKDEGSELIAEEPQEIPDSSSPPTETEIPLDANMGLEILQEESDFLGFTPQEGLREQEVQNPHVNQWDEISQEEVQPLGSEGSKETPEETKSISPISPETTQSIEITDLDGKHSFSVWLQLSKGETVLDSKGDSPEDPKETTEEALEMDNSTPEDNTESTPVDSTSRLNEKMDLIDQFIRKPPRFRPSRKDHKTLDMSKISEAGDSSIITETLAQVYRQQKHYDKAIQAYEILRLKYPEKSGLFADRILEIKKLKENK